MAKTSKFQAMNKKLSRHNYDNMVSLASFIARIHNINVVEMFLNGGDDSCRQARCMFFGTIRMYEKSSYERIADITDCFARHYSVPEVEEHINGFIRALNLAKNKGDLFWKWLDVRNLVLQANKDFFPQYE